MATDLLAALGHAGAQLAGPLLTLLDEIVSDAAATEDGATRTSQVSLAAPEIMLNAPMSLSASVCTKQRHACLRLAESNMS